MNPDDEIKKKKKEAMKKLRDDRKEWIAKAAQQVKQQKKERKAIKEYLENQPATVPEISEVTGMPSDRVLWYLATLKKYGDIIEGEKDGGYFRYVLTQSAVEEAEE
ncbi:MAG: helix-turn-helix domain-containing protein [Desulfobacterales bacterium]